MRNRFNSIEASRQSIENKLSHLQAKIKRRQNQPLYQTMPLQDIDMITNKRQNLNYGNNGNYGNALNNNNTLQRNQKLNKSISERLNDIKQRTLSSTVNVNNLGKIIQKQKEKSKSKSPLKKSKQMTNSMINHLNDNKVKQNISATTNQKIKRQNLRQSSATNNNNHRNQELSFSNSNNNVVNGNKNNNDFNYPSNLNQTELYDMIKTIMLGQQQIQKELSQIKQDLSVQPSVRKSYTAQKKSINNFHDQQKLSDTMNLRQNFDKNLNNSLNIKSKTVNLNNLQQEKGKVEGEADEEEQQFQNNSDRFNKQKPQRQRKKKMNQQNFEKLVYQAKHRKPERFKINSQSQILSQLWVDISKKIKNSNLQYKQTSHLNNRHINDHLMNTIQLQRKTKENLVNKVYSQCNNCVYK